MYRAYSGIEAFLPGLSINDHFGTPLDGWVALLLFEGVGSPEDDGGKRGTNGGKGGKTPCSPRLRRCSKWNE